MQEAILRIIEERKAQWAAKAPFLIPDGEGGTLLVTENYTVCECGHLKQIKCSYVWKGTKVGYLVELGMGASVAIYYTDCTKCGLQVS